MAALKKKMKGENNALIFLLNATAWRIVDAGPMDLHGLLIAVLLPVYAYVSFCAHLN